MSIATNDGALIHATYAGVISIPAPQFARMMSGDTILADEMYFVTAPTFQTSHAGYAWLNHVQAVAKAVELEGGGEGHVRYEVFAVR